MKLALRSIPTEVWVDVFCYPWISRRKLGKIVDKFRNRYFAEILQYCLHEREKRTLGWLELDKRTLPIIPRTPMPENIKSFKNIRIWHFDSSALAFLRNINTLFDDVNLHFGFTLDDNLANLRTMLDHLAPLLHGIHSLSFDRSAIPLVEQYFGNKLGHIKMLTIYLYLDPAPIQTGINFYMNWLISKGRDPAEPRLLKIFIGSLENFHPFSTAVQQQFLSARSPCTFAIELLYYGNNDQFANFHEENSLGEGLDGQFNERSFAIYRHKQLDSARKQLEEWVKGVVEKADISSGIEFYCITTIGQIEANADANEVNDNVEEEAGPSMSKKPKLT